MQYLLKAYSIIIFCLFYYVMFFKERFGMTNEDLDNKEIIKIAVMLLPIFIYVCIF